MVYLDIQTDPIKRNWTNKKIISHLHILTGQSTIGRKTVDLLLPGLKSLYWCCIASCLSFVNLLLSIKIIGSAQISYSLALHPPPPNHHYYPHHPPSQFPTQVGRTGWGQPFCQAQHPVQVHVSTNQFFQVWNCALYHFKWVPSRWTNIPINIPNIPHHFCDIWCCCRHETYQPHATVRRQFWSQNQL